MHHVMGDWYFDGVRTYLQLDADGKRTSKIYAEYVADPVLLWQSKAQQAGVDMDSDAGRQLRPSSLVFALWEHRNANFNG
jgi:hypothetical protein